jgi:hypothetical protein
MSWRTAQEIADELGVSASTVANLRKKGLIESIRVGKTRWRYKMPTAVKKITPTQRIEIVDAFTLLEVSILLGVPHSTVKYFIFAAKKLPARRHGNLLYVSVRDLRQFLATREGRTGQKKTHYSDILMNWLRGHLQNKTSSMKLLEAFLAKVVTVPEDRRAAYREKLWQLFDQMNEILQEMETCSQSRQ